MATSKKAEPDDKDNTGSTSKRGKTLLPIHEDALKKKLSQDKDLLQANADVLAELAAKTAALAEKVGGKEGPHQRVLKMDGKEAELKDLYAALDEVPIPIVEPKTMTSNNSESNTPLEPAVNLIREKLNRLFEDEPSASEESEEAMAVGKQRSRHQEFMYQLTTSGKSLADIQTQWHEYYVQLPNNEKHEVWQEFYKNQHTMSAYNRHEKSTKAVQQKENKNARLHHHGKASDTEASLKSDSIKSRIRNKASANGKLTASQHAKSLLFGLGLSMVVGLIIIFTFFNPVFIAPFVSPSKTVSATPIIGDVNSPVGSESKIIIPKINLEVPVVYDLNTIAESSIQTALEDGVVHFAASPEPGEQGNSVIVGHSSNNILNSGKYKFAFVLLNRLDVGDTFFVHKDGVRYSYKIYKTVIVAPDDTSVLGPAAKPNSMTLITCDPPGTSLNRLIVIAEQISPDPAANAAASIDIQPEDTVELPSNAPSLWSRIWLF